MQYISYVFSYNSTQNFGINMRNYNPNFTADKTEHSVDEGRITYTSSNGSEIIIHYDNTITDKDPSGKSIYKIEYHSDKEYFFITGLDEIEIEFSAVTDMVQSGFNNVFELLSDQRAWIFGSPSKDKIFASDADGSMVWAMDGNDKIWSGEGSTRFIYRRGEGRDKIFDFDTEKDLMDFQTLGKKLDSWKEVKSHLSNKNGNTILKLGKTKITWKDINKKELNDDNFIFNWWEVPNEPDLVL